MTDKVTLTISVEPTIAMQILALLAGDGIPTTIVNNSGENGPEPTVDEQAADELAEQEAAEAEAKKKAEAAAKRKAAREEKKRLEQEAAEKAAEEAEEEESEEADEEQVEEEQVDDEEPEADAEEDEPEAAEYTLDDIRAALGAFMKTFKTQAAGKKQLGAILGELPTPAKCLSDVEEADYGVLMAAINGDDDPLA